MTPTRPAGAPPSHIVGRAHELAVLAGPVDRVGGGDIQLAFVEGEAGIGKSRLLAEGLQEAAARGVLVLEGKADELHTARPFGAIADALDCSTRSPRSEAGRRRRAALGLGRHEGAHQEQQVADGSLSRLHRSHDDRREALHHRMAGFDHRLGLALGSVSPAAK